MISEILLFCSPIVAYSFIIYCTQVMIELRFLKFLLLIVTKLNYIRWLSKKGFIDWVTKGQMNSCSVFVRIIFIHLLFTVFWHVFFSEAKYDRTKHDRNVTWVSCIQFEAFRNSKFNMAAMPIYTF